MMARPSKTRRRQMILPAPVGHIGLGGEDHEPEMLAAADGVTAVFMMGDNPALPKMPEKPKLLDFYRLRFGDVTFRHLVTSARAAFDAGHSEKVVLACLLHDIANGALIRSDHGYWGAQLVAPYVDEEVVFAIQHHQALRYFADESVGYAYPSRYHAFFGEDFEPHEYLKRDADLARNHRFYMSARIVTINDVYTFQAGPAPATDFLDDIIGRHFRQPEEGLGFDGSSTAHMWRTMIWPNNFL
jgi:hypothetical protein